MWMTRRPPRDETIDPAVVTEVIQQYGFSRAISRALSQIPSKALCLRPFTTAILWLYQSSLLFQPVGARAYPNFRSVLPKPWWWYNSWIVLNYSISRQEFSCFTHYRTVAEGCFKCLRKADKGVGFHNVFFILTPVSDMYINNIGSLHYLCTYVHYL